MKQRSLMYNFIAQRSLIITQYTTKTFTSTTSSSQCLRKLPATNNKFTYNRGHHYQLSKRGISLFHSNLNPLHRMCANINRGLEERGGHFKSLSNVSETLHESPSDVDLLSFIKSTFDEPEGRYHCWFNKAEGSKDFFRRDGGFLVLADALLVDSPESDCSPVTMLEKIKVLQQRYSSLHVMGFQYINPTCSDAVRIRLVEIIMKEYITFPILLSKKSFSELTDGACYIIFKDGKGPLCYHKRHTDLKVIDKAIKELNLQEHNENPKLVNNVKSSWVKPIEVMKEPYISLDLRNLLLYFPGCISVDETGNRLFLSDTNHHRIIVFDSNGKILDCIGSTPGFEDGEFETAKLVRPAASFYHATEGCLYFVDSENHAIRKADIERRVLETVYPISTSDTKNNSLWSLWSWIMDNLWMTRNDVDKKSEDLDSESFLFPWHAIKSSDNDLFILNRSFETLWIMDLASGVVKQVIKGFPKILEICGQAIQEKLSLLKQMPHDWLQCQVDANCSLEGIPYAGLISSVATFQDHTVICDTVCQTIYKVSRKSGLISSFQFSNFGVLGLPYWLSFHLENVYFVGNAVSRAEFDHIQSFSLLPGRIDIQLNIDICDDTELAEPLQEDCVWCQARGAATEVSEAENRMSSSENVSSSTMSSSEKVGVAQQWYDELDNIAFSTTEINLSPEEKRTATDGKTQEGRICINCVVNASPGTSEVIISAALYLKMKRKNPNSESQEEKMQRLSNILNMRKSRRMGRDDQCIQYLLKGGNRDLEEYIFTRPLHLLSKNPF